MTSAEPLFIGIDLGTSAVKALLVNVRGEVLQEITVSLNLSTPRPGWSEQNPEDWWTATVSAVRDLSEMHPDAIASVEAIALSGQMHGATLLNRRGEVLRPAILWNDQRSGAECLAIADIVGADALVSLVANRALAGFTAPKLLWVRKHEPDICAAIDRVLLPKDYIVYRLTGTYASEPSDASGTLLFDVVNRCWSATMLDRLEIPQSWLPEIQSSHSVVAVLDTEVARQVGLRPGIPVVAGGADNACAALAMGSVDESQTMVSVGTSGTVLCASSTPRVDAQARLHTFCHVLDDIWYNMGVVLSAGASLRWYRDTIWPKSPDSSGQASNAYDAITDEAAGVPPGCEGLLFLPYLSGERTPYPDPNARGVWLGLSLFHGRKHLSRSVLEGITFALRDSVELVRDLGVDSPIMRITGGGAQSPFWLGLMADTFNKPVQPASSNGPGFGAAMLAAMGVGALDLRDIRSLVESQLTSQIVEPNPEHTQALDRQYSSYRAAYPAMADLFARLQGQQELAS